MTGYVKVHRSLLGWEWWDDHTCTRVFLYLILAVNWQEKKWMGITIKPGSMVTTHEGIASACGLTEKQVRRSLDVLESGSVIVREKAGKGQLVTLANWAKFQEDAPPEGSERAARGTSSGQRKGSERAATKEGEEVKKGRREEEEPIGSLAEPSHMRITRLLEHLKSSNGGLLDGTVKNNRNDCHTMLRRMEKEYPDRDPEEVVRQLIDIGKRDTFHTTNLTNFRYLVQNGAKIILNFKAKKNGHQLTTADRDAEFDRLAAARYGTT
jgi:hypothetical protein